MPDNRGRGAQQQQRSQQPPARRPDAVDHGPPAVMQHLPAIARPMCRDVQTLNEQIRMLADKVHLISPTMDPAYVPEFHEVSIRLVTVDDRLEAQGGTGDVYKGQGWKDNERALTRNALNRIAAAAGISWDPLRCGRVDDGSDPNYVHYRAVGWVRDIDGSRRPITAEKQSDLRDGNPNIFTDDPERMGREWANGRYTDTIKNPGYVKGWSQQRLAEARNFILEMAESKAKNRVIRQLGVRQKYTVDELKQKPFAVLALVLTGASEDPAMEQIAKQKMLDAAIATSREIYPEGNTPRQLPSPNVMPPPPDVRTPPPPLPELGVRSAPSDVDDEIEVDPDDCGCPDGPAGQHELGCRYNPREPGDE